MASSAPLELLRLAELARDVITGRGTSAGVGALLESMPSELVARLGEHLRFYDVTWPSTSQLPLALLEPHRSDWASLCLFSAHPNGRVREAALAALRPLDEPRALPFVLTRVNDWVLPIRVLAGTILETTLDARHAPSWVRCLPLLDRLMSARRANHYTLGQRVEALVLNEASAVVRHEAWHGAPVLRRRCALMLVANDATLIAHPDPQVRRLATRALGQLGPEARRAGLAPALVDRVPAVRREALALTDDPVALERALFDRARMVRELARFRLGSRDYASAYRAALSTMPGALDGLAETGRAGDIDWLTRHADDAAPLLRRRITRAIAAKAPVAWLVPLVFDEDAWLSKAASHGLARRMDESIAQELLARLPALPHAEPQIARLLGRLGRRAALLRLLELATRSTAALPVLERWLQRRACEGAARPYATDPSAALAAIERAALPAALAEELRAAL